MSAQLIESVWFDDQLNPRVQPTVMHDGVARVARSEENFQCRPSAHCFIRKLATIHTGHHDVGEKEVDVVLRVSRAAAPSFASIT